MVTQLFECGPQAGLVVVLGELLREVVDLLRGLAGVAALAGRPAAAGREVAAAGANDQVVAVAELELACLLEDVRIVRPRLRVETIRRRRDVRARRGEACVVKHLLEGLRVEAVVTGELDALEADRRDILERTLETASREEDLAVLVLAATDVRADRIELKRDLALDAAAGAAARTRAARKRRQRANRTKTFKEVPT